MAQLSNDIVISNTPRDGEGFSYSILQDGARLVYNSGSEYLSKTFVKATTGAIPVGGFNVSTYENKPTTAPFMIGAGFDGTVNDVQNNFSSYFAVGNFNSYKGNVVSKVARLDASGNTMSVFNPPIIDGEIFTMAFIGTSIVLGGNFVLREHQQIRNLVALNAFSGNVESQYLALLSPLFEPTETIYDIVLSGAANILIGGDITSYDGVPSSNLIALKHSDLSLVNTFNSNIANGSVHVINPHPANNAFWVGGLFSTDDNNVNLAYLDYSGNTKATTIRPNDRVNSIAYTSSNDIYVGGDFTATQTSNKKYITKINTSGTTDNSFVLTLNGPVTTIFPGFTPDINLIIGGVFNQANTTAVQNIVGVSASGTVSPNFVVKGYNDAIYSIDSGFNSGDILLGGRFTTWYSDTIEPVSSGDTVYFLGTESKEQVAKKLYDNLKIYNVASGLTYTLLDNKVRQTYLSNIVKVAGVGDVKYFDGVWDGVWGSNGAPSNTTIVDGGVVNTFVPASLVMARSPYIVTYPISANQNKVTFNVTIFNGTYDQTNLPQPQYQISKQRLTTSDTVLYLDISDMVRSYLSPNIDAYLSSNTPPYRGQPVGNTDTVWVNIAATIYDVNGNISTTSNKKYLALDGYLYPEYGDISAAATPIFMTSNETDVNESAYYPFKIHYSTVGLAAIQRITDKGQLNLMDFNTNYNPNNNANYIQNLAVNFSGCNEYVDYVFFYPNQSGSGTKKRFHKVKECRYDPVDIYFKNKYGVFQTITFFKRADEEINVDSKTYNRSILKSDGTFNSKKHTTVSYNVNGKQQYTLNSGVVKDYMNSSIKELFLSDEVYMKFQSSVGSFVRPITILDKSWLKKTQINDKAYSFQLKVGVAQDIINNIR
jgi:hypothetical protein